MKLGKVTYLIPIDLGFPVFFVFFALGGRPGGNGRKRRPSRCSSLLRKPSVARGRPVYVLSRRPCISCASCGTSLVFCKRIGPPTLPRFTVPLEETALALSKNKFVETNPWPPFGLQFPATGFQSSSNRSLATGCCPKSHNPPSPSIPLFKPKNAVLAQRGGYFREAKWAERRYIDK